MQRQVPEGYVVKFTHVRIPIGFGSRPGMKLDRMYSSEPSPYGGTTIARVYDKETGDLAVEAEAVCNPTDSFNKRIGRQISLGRALAILDGTMQRRRNG